VSLANPFLMKTEGLRRLSLVLAGAAYLVWIGLVFGLGFKPSPESPIFSFCSILILVPAIVFGLVILIIKTILWVRSGFGGVDVMPFNAPAVAEMTVPAAAPVVPEPVIPVPEPPVYAEAITEPVSAVAGPEPLKLPLFMFEQKPLPAPGSQVSSRAAILAASSCLFINGIIIMAMTVSGPGQQSSTSSSKPGVIDLVIAVLMFFSRKNQPRYLKWAYWRAALGLFAMPLLMATGMFGNSVVALVGYEAVCLGLLCMLHGLHQVAQEEVAEWQLPKTRMITGIALVLVGWGFVFGGSF